MTITNNIIVHTIGIKGGKLQVKNVGFTQVNLRGIDNEIIIDDYEGSGDSYKQRETQRVCIAENGITLFEGNTEELFAILKLANV